MLCTETGAKESVGDIQCCVKEQEGNKQGDIQYWEQKQQRNKSRCYTVFCTKTGEKYFGLIYSFVYRNRREI